MKEENKKPLEVHISVPILIGIIGAFIGFGIGSDASKDDVWDSGAVSAVVSMRRLENLHPQNDMKLEDIMIYIGTVNDKPEVVKTWTRHKQRWAKEAEDKNRKDAEAIKAILETNK